MAYLSERKCEAIFESSGLPQAARLQCAVELATIREQGFVQRRSTPTSGMMVLAVPTFNIQDEVAGALSIVFAHGGHDEAHVTGVLVPHMQRCAKYIASAL
jgi:IclR family pca regulon transcriptional regulator